MDSFQCWDVFNAHFEVTLYDEKTILCEVRVFGTLHNLPRFSMFRSARKWSNVLRREDCSL